MERKITIADIRQHNKREGMHFFDRDTMRFWHSKVESAPYSGNGGVYFITSEKYGDNSPRRYNVREYNPETGDVKSLDGDIGNCANKEDARLMCRAFSTDKAYSAAAWIKTFRDNCKNVKPYKVEIQGIIYSAVSYTTSDGDSVLYCLGAVPNSWRRDNKTHYKMTGDDRTWYVSSYMRQEDYNKISDDVRTMCHRHGITFQLRAMTPDFLASETQYGFMGKIIECQLIPLVSINF